MALKKEKKLRLKETAGYWAVERMQGSICSTSWCAVIPGHQTQSNKDHRREISTVMHGTEEEMQGWRECAQTMDILM